MTNTAHEQISRRALISFATNYNSASEAIMELIDNPIDYRGERPLHIALDIDKPGDRISVRDWDGAGMDLEGLRNWLNWGGGEKHRLTDIGQFHVGGKLAAMYLANQLQIACRRDGDLRIWHFDDVDWGTREEFRDAEIRELERISPHLWISQLEPEVGFVQVTLRGLRQHGFDSEVLRQRITDTYESLLESGDLIITVDGRQLEPHTLPWLDGIEQRTLDPEEVYQDVWVSGRIGALDRRQLGTGQSDRVRSGIRTTFNGRKISDGETFGINLGGRGTTQRLFGEVDIRGGGLRPNQNKTGWDVDSRQWGAVTEYIKPIMREVLTDLQNLSKSGTAKNSAKTPGAASPKKHALSFMLQWRNQGAELQEAREIEHIALQSRMSPKEWVKTAVRRMLHEQNPDIVD